MSFLITTIAMFLFWILLSGEFTFILIASGVIASLIVAYLSHDIFIGKPDLKTETGRVFKFISVCALVAVGDYPMQMLKLHILCLTQSRW